MRTGSSRRDWRLSTVDCRLETDSRQSSDCLFFSVFSVVGAPAWRNSERPHLSIQIAAFHAEHFCGTGDVSLLDRKLPENVLALELIAGDIERHRRSCDLFGRRT